MPWAPESRAQVSLVTHSAATTKYLAEEKAERQRAAEEVAAARELAARQMHGACMFQAIARGYIQRLILKRVWGSHVEVIYVLGGPGAGKSTICRAAANKLGRDVHHISTGELLRAERRRETARSRLRYHTSVRSVMADGGHVSDAIVCGELCAAIRRRQVQHHKVYRARALEWQQIKYADGGETAPELAGLATEFEEVPQLLIFVDGFPRTLAQLETWNRDYCAKMPSLPALTPAHMLLVEVTEQVMAERVAQRRQGGDDRDDEGEDTVASHGRQRHYHGPPPPPGVCGGGTHKK
jgi:adenylate kinase family enzyme